MCPGVFLAFEEGMMYAVVTLALSIQLAERNPWHSKLIYYLFLPRNK